MLQTLKNLVKNIRMRNKIFRIFIIFGLNFFFANHVCAASFSCSKAFSKIEKLICTNVELSSLDGNLGEVFASVSKNNTGLVEDQKKWLLDQRNNCKDAKCLKDAYTKRIKELESAFSVCENVRPLLGNLVKG